MSQKIKISKSVSQSTSTTVSNDSITKQSTITKTTSVIYDVSKKRKITLNDLEINQELYNCRRLKSSSELSLEQYYFLEHYDPNLLTELLKTPSPYYEEEIDEENNQFSYGNTPENTSNENSMIDSFDSGDSYPTYNKSHHYNEYNDDEPELECEFDD